MYFLKVQQTNRVDQTHRERGSEWQKAVAGFAAGAFMLPGLWRHPPVTSRPSIGQITQQIQSRSRTRRSQSVVTQRLVPEKEPGLHVSIDWWRQDIPKTYAEKCLMM